MLSLTPEQLATLSRGEQERLLALLREKQRRFDTNLFDRLYPDEDVIGADGNVLIHARAKYQRHLEFFRAGATHTERCFMAANRVGKTLGGGAYEITAHATGRYPHWWEGRRFKRPVRIWCAGFQGETTRDIIQTTLFGGVQGSGAHKGLTGTGTVPGNLIDQNNLKWKSGGVPDLLDTVKVKHVAGGWSTIGLKAYNQGRKSFEGTAQDVIWFDEEPPQDVYDEAFMRIATTNGIALLTFTPLEGLSEVVLGFLPSEQRPKSPEDIEAELEAKLV